MATRIFYQHCQNCDAETTFIRLADGAIREVNPDPVKIVAEPDWHPATGYVLHKTTCSARGKKAEKPEKPKRGRKALGKGLSKSDESQPELPKAEA